MGSWEQLCRESDTWRPCWLLDAAVKKGTTSSRSIEQIFIEHLAMQGTVLGAEGNTERNKARPRGALQSRKRR